VLFVEMLVSSAGLPALNAIGEDLALPGGPRVTLTLSADLLDQLLNCGEWLSKVSVNILPPYSGDCGKLVGRVKEICLALWSTPEGLLEFEGAIGIAKELGWAISILNPHAKAVALKDEDRANAQKKWREAGEPSSVSLRVHDLFLSEALGLDPFASYAGCAGASTLAHLTHAGKLVACRTLPLELGDLLDSSLADIWKMEGRGRVAKVLSGTPEECLACSLAGSCGGGCPGLAPGAGLMDSSCAGVRD